HYLDLDYDLSNIFFITTANSLHTIPLPLRDRMEIIELSGYLEQEKKHIVKNFLLTKQMEANGITENNVKISENCITDIIRYYTKEAGVRNLERQIATLCRKVAMQLVSSNSLDKKVTINVQNLNQFLGVRKYRFGDREHTAQLGVCTGLAYTELGGDLLLVEAIIMHGTGAIQITGKLGDVMIESAKAAVSYVRSRSDDFGLKEDFHKCIDIHIHVPEGAIPKDGPSAGVTLATALISSLTGIPIRNDIAMTGEISLRGRVLPIGGLREKLYAAKRGSIQTVFIPKDNEKDLQEIPDDILSGLTIVPVEHIDEILPLALQIESSTIFENVIPSKPLYLSLQKQEISSNRIQQ
ncbi:MAG: endopeptidase La, partial [Desulfovibrionaceae bacterium]|nr:endopeptidase La [Desulfovibrionaceae bacterium]